MLAIFNELGALESFDKEGDLLNQGAVGIVLKAQFKNIKNTDYIASINYTRSDGSKSSKLLMNLDAENENGYVFKFDNEWYFALDGETTFTIFLYDSSENIIANGQAQFYIAKTDYDSSDSTITPEQYDTLLSTLKQKINYTDIVDYLGSEETDKPLSANMGRELDVRLGEVETGKANLSETNERFGSVEHRLDNLEDGKVSIINNLDDDNPYILYGAEFNDTETEQKTYPMSEDAIERTIARRTTNGELLVGDPTLESSATTKKYVNELLNLYVKYSNIDTDFSLTSTNPIQNKVISKQIEDINYTIMVMKEELFETILSEIDYKVDYATIYPIPDTLTDSDGTHRVVYSDTQLKEIEGNSFVLKQLLPVKENSETINGITFTHNGDGTISVVGTATATTNHYFDGPTGGLLANHKYLLKGCPSGGSSTSYSLYCSDNLYDRGNGFIATITSNQTPSCRIEIYNGITINATFRPQLFELTDNITTVAEFNRIFPLTYYPYNAGEIKNTVIKGVKVNGYNLFDGELEDGWINNSGQIQFQENGPKSSTNLIPVVGGQEYTLTVDKPCNQKYIVEYDKNGVFIQKRSLSPSITSLTLSNNTYFARIQFTTNPYDETAKACFHLTGSRTGYAPYKEPRTIQIPQTELLSAGSVHDTIKFVEGNIIEGEQRFNMVYVSRIGSVDLGSLNWTWQSANNCWFTSNLSTLAKAPTNNNNKANIIAEKYEILSFTNANTNSRGMALTNSSSLFYYTSDSTNAPSGILNYEKVEPTETTLATDLTFEEVSAIIEQGGSIETIFENVPPNLKTAFVVNKAIVS